MNSVKNNSSPRNNSKNNLRKNRNNSLNKNTINSNYIIINGKSNNNKASVLSTIKNIFSNSVNLLLIVVTLVVLAVSIYFLVKYLRERKLYKLIGRQQLDKVPQHTDKANVKEVYHVADNVYTHSEAEAVCRALDSELATVEQLEEAYNKGANWCSYGWTKTDDGKSHAYYPIQPDFWNKIQRDETCGLKDQCGVPGINGGVHDKNVLFGVNCFGVKRKPTHEEKKAVNLLCGSDINNNELVNKIRGEADEIMFAPFAQGRWSAVN